MPFLWQREEQTHVGILRVEVSPEPRDALDYQLTFKNPSSTLFPVKHFRVRRYHPSQPHIPHTKKYVIAGSEAQAGATVSLPWRLDNDQGVHACYVTAVLGDGLYLSSPLLRAQMPKEITPPEGIPPCLPARSSPGADPALRSVTELSGPCLTQEMAALLAAEVDASLEEERLQKLATAHAAPLTLNDDDNVPQSDACSHHSDVDKQKGTPYLQPITLSGVINRWRLAMNKILARRGDRK